jgi:hypothetical protein
MRRSAAVVAMAVGLMVVASSCQTGVTMWTECAPAADGNVFGTDGTYVLACRLGEWVPVMTTAEYVAIRARQPVTLAPLPARPVSWDPYLTCQDSADFVDVALHGPPDTYDNATPYMNLDGTCGGMPLVNSPLTVVQAPGAASAALKCAALRPAAPPVSKATDHYPGMPPDAWFCTNTAP